MNKKQNLESLLILYRKFSCLNYWNTNRRIHPSIIPSTRDILNRQDFSIVHFNHTTRVIGKPIARHASEICHRVNENGLIPEIVELMFDLDFSYLLHIGESDREIRPNKTNITHETTLRNVLFPLASVAKQPIATDELIERIAGEIHVRSVRVLSIGHEKAYITPPIQRSIWKFTPTWMQLTFYQKNDRLG